MRITKKELEADIRRLGRENTVLHFALTDVMRGVKPDAIEKVRGPDKGESYEYRLYRSTAPHGGIVVTTFRYPGQHDHVTATYLDEVHTLRLSAVAELDHRCAIERLKALRNNLILGTGT